MAINEGTFFAGSPLQRGEEEKEKSIQQLNKITE